MRAPETNAFRTWLLLRVPSVTRSGRVRLGITTPGQPNPASTQWRTNHGRGATRRLTPRRPPSRSYPQFRRGNDRPRGDVSIISSFFDTLYGLVDRIDDSLYLVSQGLMGQPVLYLSRAIIEDKDRYYRLLHGVTATGAWGPWIEFMLECVERTAIWTTDNVRAIRLLQARTGRVVQERCPTAYSHELVSLLFERPYLRISDIVDAGLAKRQTAATYARSLVAAGVLEERQAGQANFRMRSRSSHEPRRHPLVVHVLHAVVPADAWHGRGRGVVPAGVATRQDAQAGVAGIVSTRDHRL